MDANQSTEQPKKTRRQIRIERRAEKRAQRVAERDARRSARKKRRRYAPPLVQFPENADPLVWYDRNKQPIGHVLRDLWRPSAGFLIGGGPSLQTMDLSPLRERGIVSLGINNVCGHVPVRAMTFSDPPEKFHHGIFFDPAIMKFVPVPKLWKRVRVKCDDGKFRFCSMRVGDCPNVWGYQRNAIWDAPKFLWTEAATWGNGKDGVALNGRPKILFTFFLGLRLMHYLGCRDVYMIGVDFSMREESGDRDPNELSKGYAFGQQRTAGAARGNNNHYRLAQTMCTELRPFLERDGFNVYNCNPNSYLTAFDYVPYETAVENCRGITPLEPFDLGGWYEKTEDGKPENADREDDR